MSDIQLERPCPECDGGVAYNHLRKAFPCPNCDGFGVVLTETGRNVVALIRRRTHLALIEEIVPEGA